MTNGERKSFWGKGVVFLYGGFVVMILSIVFWVSRQNFDLVEPDYYSRELNFQQQIDRIKRTGRLTQSIRVEYDRNSKQLLVRYPSDLLNKGIAGTIHLFRPSDANRDRRVGVEPGVDGIQYIPANELARGRWKVLIDWNAAGIDYYTEESLVIE
ncbi:MAG: FixH family protein [Candidatus Zixiibacteriota bacterium]